MDVKTNQKVSGIGGGYIGLGMGSVYADLGSKVSIVEMTDGFLPGTDRDLVKVFEKHTNLSQALKSLREQMDSVSTLVYNDCV